MLRPLDHLRAGERLLARCGRLVHDCLLAVLALTLPALQALAFAALSGCGLALVTPCVVSIIAGATITHPPQPCCWHFSAHILCPLISVCLLIACCRDTRTVDCSWHIERHYTAIALGPSSFLGIHLRNGADLWEEHVRGRAFGTVLLVGSLGAHPAQPVRAGKGARRGCHALAGALGMVHMSNRSCHIVYNLLRASKGGVVLAAGHH